MKSSSKSWLLFLMAAYFAMAYVDRYIISVTLRPIGLEFGLSDLQLGLLSGFAFAVFFATMTLPLAFLSTRIGHGKMISISVGFWSIATLVAGFSQNFAHLILSRMGVGLGEAGAIPASHTVIAQNFEPHERTSALAVFYAGSNVGIAIALVAGGYITQHYGWRTAMFVAGGPGIVLSLLFWIATKGLRRTSKKTDGSDTKIIPAIARKGLVIKTAKHMWHSLPIRWTLLATVLAATTTFATSTWMPTFLVRTHGFELSFVGFYIAMNVGVGGAIGTVIAGKLSDKLSSKSLAWLVWVPAIGLLVAKPFAISGLLSSSPTACLILLAVPTFFGGIYIASSISVIYRFLADELHPVGSAILVMLANLIGLSAGPFLVGLVSGFFASKIDGLTAGLVFVQVFGLTAIFVYFHAGRVLKNVNR